MDVDIQSHVLYDQFFVFLIVEHQSFCLATLNIYP